MHASTALRSKMPALWTATLIVGGAFWQGATAESLIANAAERGDLREVREFVAAGVEIDAPQADGSTALLWAAYQTDIEMVSTLLEAGADPDRANEFGITPLIQASRYGNAPLIEALADAGADIERRSPKGVTPLMAAARTGIGPAVTALLERGADPNATESAWHQTALMWAASEGHFEVVDTLLEAGADPDMQARVTELTERSINADFPTGGFTAVMWAVREGHADIVRRLAEGGADLDLMNGDGATAMMIAVVNDRFDLAAELVELGADANDGSLYQAVVMRDATTDWLAQDGSRLRRDYENELTALGLIEVFLEAGADPNKPFVGQLHSRTMCCDTYANATPFFRAAVAADVEALKLLIEHGADLEWSPSSVSGASPAANEHVGKTPVMVAMNGGKGVGMAGGPGDIREGRPPPFREQANRNPADAVHVLLEAGADPDAATPEGETALHEAVRAGKLEIIELLANAGATLDKPNAEGLTPLYLAENPLSEEESQGAVIMAEDEGAPPEEVAALLRDLLARNDVPAQASLNEGQSE